MEGIEKIAGRVLQDAQAEADALRRDAETAAAGAQAAARQEAADLKDALVRAADGEAAALYDRLVSSADTEAKKSALSVKQALLAEAFDKAVERLRGLPEAEYLSLLAALAVKASETGTEQVILSAEDRERVGEAVVAEANRLSGKSLTLSPETRPILGGLILSQGRIEINCALDTLAARSRSQLLAEAAKRLFD